MWYHTYMKYYSAIKKNDIIPFAATWMGLESVILSEGSWRRRNIICHFLYVESKKIWYKQIYLQSKNRLIDLENKLTVARGKDVGKE